MVLFESIGRGSVYWGGVGGSRGGMAFRRPRIGLRGLPGGRSGVRVEFRLFSGSPATWFKKRWWRELEARVRENEVGIEHMHSELIRLAQEDVYQIKRKMLKEIDREAESNEEEGFNMSLALEEVASGESAREGSGPRDVDALALKVYMDVVDRERHAAEYPSPEERESNPVFYTFPYVARELTEEDREEQEKFIRKRRQENYVALRKDASQKADFLREWVERLVRSSELEVELPSLAQIEEYLRSRVDRYKKEFDPDVESESSASREEMVGYMIALARTAPLLFRVDMELHYVGRTRKSVWRDIFRSVKVFASPEREAAMKERFDEMIKSAEAIAELLREKTKEEEEECRMRAEERGRRDYRKNELRKLAEVVYNYNSSRYIKQQKVPKPNDNYFLEYRVLAVEKWYESVIDTDMHSLDAAVVLDLLFPTGPSVTTPSIWRILPNYLCMMPPHGRIELFKLLPEFRTFTYLKTIDMPKSFYKRVAGDMVKAVALGKTHVVFFTLSRSARVRADSAKNRCWMSKTTELSRDRCVRLEAPPLIAFTPFSLRGSAFVLGVSSASQERHELFALRWNYKKKSYSWQQVSVSLLPPVYLPGERRPEASGLSDWVVDGIAQVCKSADESELYLHYPTARGICVLIVNTETWQAEEVASDFPATWGANVIATDDNRLLAVGGMHEGRAVPWIRFFDLKARTWQLAHSYHERYNKPFHSYGGIFRVGEGCYGTVGGYHRVSLPLLEPAQPLGMIWSIKTVSDTEYYARLLGSSAPADDDSEGAVLGRLAEASDLPPSLRRKLVPRGGAEEGLA
ncbi:uncharacterized protein LOC126322714 [Schistocerca gregaria]|uniref:uncharacterized protein LOC126322714 n=1 Tax=Schistocerca gregaria TaxID=7010 RepID=UPI00211DB91F|nr:uncharacterized protein LOC126322714 [Schistocerca gregaria]